MRYRSIRYILLVFAFAAVEARAAQIELSWKPPSTNADGTPLTDLAGFKIYYGTSSKNYEFTTDVGNVEKYVLKGLKGTTKYYFAATAYDQSGLESEFSNEASSEGSGGSPESDSDKDGLTDDVDNCPQVSNPEQTDTDGDEIGDICDPDPSTPNTRHIRLDFDGDKISDIGMTNLPSKGSAGGLNFQVELSSNATVLSAELGAGGSEEVHGDYDGDGLYDLAVIKKVQGNLVWTIRDTASTQESNQNFGHSRDFAIAGCDFDKDSRSDLATFFKTSLRVKYSSSGGTRTTRFRDLLEAKLVTCGDIDDDGADELLVYGVAKGKTKVKGKKSRSKGKKKRSPQDTSRSSSYLLGFRSTGQKIFQKRATRVRGIFAADANNDGIEDFGYAISKGQNTTLFFLTEGDTTTDPVSVQVSNLKQLAVGMHPASDNALHYGIVILKKDGSLQKISLYDLATADANSLASGNSLMRGVNTTKRRRSVKGKKR